MFSQYIETRYTADLLGAASSRVAAGGTPLDPEVVTHLLGASRHTDGLGSFTARERDVPGEMAEGQTRPGPSDADHRRVLAVLRYLAS